MSIITTSSEEFEIQNGTLYRYKGKQKNVVIPDNVSIIGENAFYGKENIESIVVPSCVKAIKRAAFCFCRKLKHISLPEGLETIEKSAFALCISLTEVVVPQSVTTIGSRAFESCNHVINFVLPESLESIEEDTFKGCYSIEEITLPHSLRSIGNGAFHECKRLQTVVFPEEMTRIGERAFENCWELSSISIPNSLVEIGDEAFNNCRTLSKVEGLLPHVEIGEKAFCGCASLQNEDGFVIVSNVLFDYYGTDEAVVVPEGVSKIDTEAFCRDNCISSISFPESLKKISAFAFPFRIGRRIQEVHIKSLEQWCHSFWLRHCFSSQYRLFVNDKLVTDLRIPDGITIIESSAFENAAIESVSFPDSLVEIGVAAFSGCTRLKTIYLPANVERVHFGAFRKCPGLVAFEIQNERCKLIDEVLGDSLPEGLKPHAASLAKHMNTKALKQYVLKPDVWQRINEETKYEILLKQRTKSTIPLFAELCKDNEIHNLAQKLLDKISTQTTSKELASYLKFMSDFQTLLDPSLIEAFQKKANTFKSVRKAAKN